MAVNSQLEAITQRIRERSQTSRQVYLERLEHEEQFARLTHLSCGNIAHGVAGCSQAEQQRFLKADARNYGIVSAYNDVLSAHEPYQHFPELIKKTFLEMGHGCQFAGGVPAMCDGVTQGQIGMELSLFSRDLIAQATAIALSHRTFDAALMLGICDKIVPGLIIGSLHFGQLPIIFVPGGPMPSGLPNKDKVAIRQAYATGKVGKDELMKAELDSYHSPGTCTFYGTANTNQMVVEAMGLQLPGSSFVPPYTELRDDLTREAAYRLHGLVGKKEFAFGRLLDERAIVNGLVALMASGGSTNHTIHMIAIARAAGIIINWSDFNDISRITPLLAKIYPNGPADINSFFKAGNTGFLFGQLLSAGLMHDIPTVMGESFGATYTKATPREGSIRVEWPPVLPQSEDVDVLRAIDEPFDIEGGLHALAGNIGRGIVKNSAIAKELHYIEGPARCFNDIEGINAAFKAGKLNQDCVIVLRYQGPKACGIPELHGLMSIFGHLIDNGYKIAVVTDGRMSGASGKVPIVLHVCPEALEGGNIGRIRDNDQLVVDMAAGRFEVVGVDNLEQRLLAAPDLRHNEYGVGRALFSMYRQRVTTAEEGATTFALPGTE